MLQVPACFWQQATPATSNPRARLPPCAAHLRYFERGYQLFSGIEPYLQHALQVREAVATLVSWCTLMPSRLPCCVVPPAVLRRDGTCPAALLTVLPPMLSSLFSLLPACS